jgi:hypothetical protein
VHSTDSVRSLSPPRLRMFTYSDQRSGLAVRAVCVHPLQLRHRKLLVSNHFAKIDDVLLDSGDFLWPGIRAVVWYSGSGLSFCFGESVECVLEFLFERRAVHMRRVSLGMR